MRNLAPEFMQKRAVELRLYHRTSVRCRKSIWSIRSIQVSQYRLNPDDGKREVREPKSTCPRSYLMYVPCRPLPGNDCAKATCSLPQSQVESGLTTPPRTYLSFDLES